MPKAKNNARTTRTGNALGVRVQLRSERTQAHAVKRLGALNTPVSPRHIAEQALNGPKRAAGHRRGCMASEHGALERRDETAHDETPKTTHVGDQLY